jgi:hypothetical protein
VTHMPLVPTGQLGNPVAVLVLVVADNRTLHSSRVRRGGRRGSLFATPRLLGTDCPRATKPYAGRTAD